MEELPPITLPGIYASPKPKKKKKKPAKKAAASTARMDLRLPKRLKVKVYLKAKQQRRTVTSVIVELIEKMK